ncbi:MAG TPA: hopanoid-associated sugar epimerase [Syntrophorhabdaceae bacterium]|jgi:dihydroflavonol-4-reductase
MTRVLVTGASGFIGFHVAKALSERGFEVLALVRNASDSGFISRCGAKPVAGDVRDYESVLKAMRGCDRVFHVAADYRLWVPDPERMYEINVGGTANVMKAALERSVTRVVYTSTVGILRVTPDGKPGNEENRARFQDLSGHYKISKFLAEKEVRRCIGVGLPAVIVNPTFPIGAMDRKPTPTGKTIVDFLNGKMPAYVNTGLNLVDVGDVAEGHVLAAESGVVGESYILGNENLTLKQFLHLLARLTGMKPPRWRLPYGPVLCLAYADRAYSKVCGGKEPRIPVDGVRMARHYMFFDTSKAVLKLGMAQNSIESAAWKAISWYREKGYVPRLSGECHE